MKKRRDIIKNVLDAKHTITLTESEKKRLEKLRCSIQDYNFNDDILVKLLKRMKRKRGI